jgi:hypothetical protein
MTWLVAAFSLAATVLNVRRLRASFAIWIGTNAAWAFYDFAHGLPAQGCLMCVYAGLAIVGFLAWGRPPPHPQRGGHESDDRTAEPPIAAREPLARASPRSRAW